MSSITQTIRSAASSLEFPGIAILLNLARDLNTDGPLPTGHGKKAPVSTARSGQTQVLLLDPKGQLHGARSMPNISDWPNDAAVCSLSQVLVRGSIPPQYFLSSTACAGILRRAEKRGKVLPEPLMRALTAVAFPAQTGPAAGTSCPLPGEKVAGVVCLNPNEASRGLAARLAVVYEIEDWELA